MASKKAFIVEDMTDLVSFLNMLIHKSLISKAKIFYDTLNYNTINKTVLIVRIYFLQFSAPIITLIGTISIYFASGQVPL